MGFPTPDVSNLEKVSLLLIETLDKPHALAIDEIIKAEEIVIKPLDRFLQNISEFVGATILGNGSVVPVLDLIYLLKQKDSEIEQTEQIPAPQKENRRR